MGQSLGQALSDFVSDAQGIYNTFVSTEVFSIGGWTISQYTLWMFIVLAVVLFVILYTAKHLQLVPENKFFNTIEFGYTFVKGSIGEDVVGAGFEKHVPFLATLFFFIVTANALGLIPGFKAATGTISVTWALSLISFIYFNFYGFKTLGLGGYIKSLVPHGVPGPMKPVIWVLEFFSMVLRLLTLAVRLYGNMLSGHMILAVFSIATTVFMQYAFFTADFITGIVGILWFVLLIAMYALETLVAFLQAYVFTILSASYIGLAVHPH
ncbi:MAG: F0F1 ATP synthase subunit A [Eggerthellaceae bacterium]|jgi:F-type H+-transporting ATPase subunit a